MSLRISYDRNLKIGAVGPSAWAKLGPEDWFKGYKIICANSREYQAEYILDLGLSSSDIGEFTTQNVVESNQFLDLATGEMSDYRFIIYKPVKVPQALSADRFIANDLSFSRFESKHYFRQQFAGKLPIPEFIVLQMDDLVGMDAEEAYATLSGQLGSEFVLQDSVGGGGRGTFIIKSLEDTRRALETLAMARSGDVCIVSKFIAGIERSIQVFVSSEHTVQGPMQQQLTRNPELLNPEGRGGMFFCGGQFHNGVELEMKAQVDRIVETAATVLSDAGYKGIFGLDFLVDLEGKVYVLEINARTTGLLPLLNEQTSELPLYLLHILELAGVDYEILPQETQDDPVGGPKSFVALFNQQAYPACFDSGLTTGNYRLTPESFEKIDDRARWHAEADFMVQSFCTADLPAKPNLKLCNIFFKEKGFDDRGTLTECSRKVVNLLKKHIVQAQPTP